MKFDIFVKKIPIVSAVALHIFLIVNIVKVVGKNDLLSSLETLGLYAYLFIGLLVFLPSLSALVIKEERGKAAVITLKNYFVTSLMMYVVLVAVVIAFG